MYYDFWDMTLGEVIDYIKAYNIKERNDCKKMYLLADLISSFVWTKYSNKKIPSYEEIFPPMDEKEEEERNRRNNKRIAEMMKAFADAHNAKRHNEVK